MLVFFIPAVPFLLGVAAIVRGVRMLLAGLRFRRRAMRAAGVVADVRQEISINAEPGQVPRSRVYARFVTAEDREVEMPMMTSSTHEHLRRGDPVVVLYDPFDPTTAQLERNRGTEVILAVLIIMFGIVCSGGGLVGIGIAALVHSAIDHIGTAFL